MSPRLKLRAAVTPLVVAGALWATGGATSVVLGGGTPPPCGPDGVCVPRPQTYGWYQTRWRTFPGDVARPAPTPAVEAKPEEELGGPKEPTPAEEGLLGPAKAPRTGGAGGEEPAAEGAADPAAADPAAGPDALPGDIPLPGIELPGFGPAAPAGEAPAPAAGGAPEAGGVPAPEGDPAAVPQPAPGAEPAADPLDPFGALRQAPPWLSSATQIAPAAAARGVGSPHGEPADLAAFAAPETAAASDFDGPNLHGDDAPPTLPAALRGVRGAAPARRTAPPQASAARVDRRVATASAESPVGIELINPAASLVDGEAAGPQQAIYFEASDR